MNRVFAVSLVLLSACEPVQSFFSAQPVSPSGQTAAQPVSMPVDQACPAWTTLQACAVGDTAYAVASSKTKGKLSMVIDAASRRARAGLLGREPKDETVTLTGALLPAWAKCGDDVFVLASGPKGAANLPACTQPPTVGVPPLAACPAWTSSLLVKRGPGFAGVGMSEGIEDPAFAVKAAENRARAKLVEAVSVQLTFAAGAISMNSAGGTEDAQTLSSTTCAGITFAQVAGSATANPMNQDSVAKSPAELQAQMEKEIRESLATKQPQVDRARVSALASKVMLKKFHAFVVATHAADAKHQKAMEAIGAACGTNLPLCLQLQKKNKDIKIYRAKAAATKKKLKLSDEDAADMRVLWKSYFADAKVFAQNYGDSAAAMFAAQEPVYRKVLGLSH